MSDLFPSLFVGHDSVAGCSPSSASTAFLRCFLLEESGTDLFVEHPNNRLDHIRFIFSSGRIDIPLKVHLDCDSESSVTNVVVGTAVASANNVVWARFGDYIAVVEAVHVVHIGGKGIHVDTVVHAIVVEAGRVEIVAVHDVGGGIDDCRRRGLHRASVLRMVGVITDHTAVARRNSSRCVKVG